MPRGTYRLFDRHDGTVLALERFACAPGPSGWRYVGEAHDPGGGGLLGTVDVTTDADWRPLRVEVSSGGWRVRGGFTGTGLSWVRMPVGSGGPAPGGRPADPPEATEGTARARAFAGSSPVFLLVAARQLRLVPGARTRTRVVALSTPALAAVETDQEWVGRDSRSHSTDEGPLRVDTYAVTDLASGETTQVHLAGDVVVAADGVELVELLSPPTPAPAYTG